MLSRSCDNLRCVQDEVTGLAVSERYIVAQYFMEPKIDVFDRKSLKLLHRLEGTTLFMTPQVTRCMINQF